MKTALGNAIYYIHGNDNIYLKYHLISDHIFQDPEEFNSIMMNLNSDIQVRNIFGNQDNICYDIFRNIGKYYHDLLIGNLDSLLIISRKDNAIKISRKLNSKKSNIGIVKIDSVLAELNLGEYNSVSWYKYPLYLVGIVGLGLLGSSVYSAGGGFDGFLKSD